MNSEFKEQERDGFNNWITGVVLIGVGIILVASNLTGFSFQNWWALFILIPAIYQLSIVWRGYQENGRLTSASTGPLIGGLGALAVAAVFLIDGISWGVIWPIAFVFGGISLLLSQR
ncbi:MAG: hypothetical protein AAF614_35410 [Chloroflexota bacterium]